MAVSVVTDLGNRALVELGLSAIPSFVSPTTPEGLVISTLYEPVLRDLQASTDWVFCQYVTDLARLSTAPLLSPYTSAFVLPADFVHFKTVSSSAYLSDGGRLPASAYRFVGDKLYALYSTVSLFYRRRVFDVSLFPDYFTSLFVAALAERACYTLLREPKRAEALREVRLERLFVAREENARYSNRISISGLARTTPAV